MGSFVDLLHCLDIQFIAARISILHWACTVFTAFIHFITSELRGKVHLCPFNSLFCCQRLCLLHAYHIVASQALSVRIVKSLPRYYASSYIKTYTATCLHILLTWQHLSIIVSLSLCACVCACACVAFR